MLGLGGRIFPEPIEYLAGSSTGSLAVGDFNGDGAPDLAAANAGSRDVAVLLNAADWASGARPAGARIVPSFTAARLATGPEVPTPTGADEQPAEAAPAAVRALPRESLPVGAQLPTGRGAMSVRGRAQPTTPLALAPAGEALWQGPWEELFRSGAG